MRKAYKNWELTKILLGILRMLNVELLDFNEILLRLPLYYAFPSQEDQCTKARFVKIFCHSVW